MEQLLRELIAINREMLSELKMLRRDLAGSPGKEASTPSAISPQPAQTKTPPPRFTPEDLEDIHGSLIEGLKKRNKDKSNAFSEFEKRHKDW